MPTTLNNFLKYLHEIFPSFIDYRSKQQDRILTNGLCKNCCTNTSLIATCTYYVFLCFALFFFLMDLEKVQRRATKTIKVLTKKLKQPGLLSWERRRPRDEMIKVYRITKVVDKVTEELLSPNPDIQELIGQQFKAGRRKSTLREGNLVLVELLRVSPVRCCDLRRFRKRLGKLTGNKLINRY